MKRLLEWKERMQQSPLSPKLPPNVNNINEMANQAMAAVRSQNVKQPMTSFQFDSVPQYDVHKRSQDLLEMSRHSVRNDHEYPIESGKPNYVCCTCHTDSNYSLKQKRRNEVGNLILSAS